MKTVMNDETVRQAAEKVAADIAELSAPPSTEDVLTYCEEDVSAVRRFLPRWSHAGEFDGKGESGFVGTVYIPPYLAASCHGGDVVAIHYHQALKGPVADMVAPLREYLKWHEEITQEIKDDISQMRKSQLEWLGKRDPVSDWEAKKDAALKSGFTLLEIRNEVDSTKHGRCGGKDTYLVGEEIDEAGAERLLDALDGRHERPRRIGEHGQERISLIKGGFEYEWAGPWAD